MTRPKLSWVLATWNPYRKGDLEDTTQNIYEVYIYIVGNANLHVYSGHRWMLKGDWIGVSVLSINAQHFTAQAARGKKAISQMRTPVVLYNTTTGYGGAYHTIVIRTHDEPKDPSYNTWCLQTVAREATCVSAVCDICSTTERSPHTAVLLVAVVTLLCFFLDYSECKAQSTATLSVNIMNTAS